MALENLIRQTRLLIDTGRFKPVRSSVEELLKHVKGSEKKRVLTDILFYAITKFSSTSDKEQIIDLLLSRGADASHINEQKLTPTLEALCSRSMSRIEVVWLCQSFILKGADKTINHLGDTEKCPVAPKGKHTALHLGVAWRSEILIDWMLDRTSADPDARNSYGLRPAEMALEMLLPSLAEKIIAKGGTVDARKTRVLAVVAKTWLESKPGSQQEEDALKTIEFLLRLGASLEEYARSSNRGVKVKDAIIQKGLFELLSI